MKIEETPLTGVLILTPARFGDARGFFSESWNRARMAEAGIDIDFVQDNHSLSQKAGTVRGLHFQAPPHAQAKLVRCGRGALFDVAVDIRAGSPTYGQWFGTELSAENGRQLLVPVGFAHGFVTLCDDTEIIYKCSDYYAPDCDRAIAHDDPDIGIDWGVSRAKRILSEKDAAAPTLAGLGPPFKWEEQP
ncbi:dTDP-4-dehydrorhamnose 3,5-epimerase (plasmid) [Shimia sp. W99]